ncbi:hypothetical protein G9A89_005919 [Geosiphon pyriformis]|nr:hypothetical protein G9A89_005919 [Geosiphon pyriformis]
MKQEETKAAINANYFTAPQILNQFICGLCSSILQHVRPLHLGTLQEAVTHARDFESAESKANYTHAINLVMNGSSELDSKLKQFSDSINQKLERYLANNCAIYQPPQQRNNPGNTNQQIADFIATIHNWEINIKTRSQISDSESLPKSSPISNHLPAHNAAANLLTTSISTSNLSAATTNNLSTATTSHLSAITPPQNSVNMTSGHFRPRITQNWKSAMVVHQLIPSSSNPPSGSCSWNSDISAIQNPNSQNYLSLLVISEDATSDNSETNQQATLTSNIPPATVTNNKSLAAIFPFELKKPFPLLLFNGAVLKEKSITVMYTDVKVDGHPIKFILDSGSAGSIITKQLMNQLGCRVDQTASTKIITADNATKMPIGEINDFPIEVNGIITLIKVLVMEATQYQALVGNDWLVKTNTVLN